MQAQALLNTDLSEFVVFQECLCLLFHRSAIEITSKRGNAVLISADDYDAWQETAYLFRSPANARRLLDAADEAARGGAVERVLDRE